jgi:hypothetical protein
VTVGSSVPTWNWPEPECKKLGAELDERLGVTLATEVGIVEGSKLDDTLNTDDEIPVGDKLGSAPGAADGCIDGSNDGDKNNDGENE